MTPSLMGISACLECKKPGIFYKKSRVTHHESTEPPESFDIFTAARKSHCEMVM